MPDLRVVMMSVLAIAMALALANLPPPHMPLPLSSIDWRDIKPALTCPSDLPQDCAILWGP